MRMQEIANSYKYMYENCAGGLLDALVISLVQYMHAVCNCFYGKWFALIAGNIRRRGGEEQWENGGVMTGKSIIENDKHI